jgi:DNA-binding MarR family transcriptional regulator
LSDTPTTRRDDFDRSADQGSELAGSLLSGIARDPLSKRMGKTTYNNHLHLVSRETIMVSMESDCGAKPSRLETHLGYWLRGVSNAVSGSFARSLQERQTSVAEWVLLRCLYDRKQATPGELAEAVTMTRGAISKIIDKLQAKGWIRTRIKPEDNRVQLVSLTTAGRRVVPELAGIADHNDDHFFAFLNTGERHILRALLIKLANHHQIRDVPFE